MQSIVWNSFGLFLVALMLNGCKSISRYDSNHNVSNLKDEQSTASLSELVVAKTEFSSAIRQQMRSLHQGEVEAMLQSGANVCSQVQSVLNSLMRRLVEGAALQPAVTQDPPFTIGVACLSRELKFPELRGGMLWIYPDLLRALESEDQMAALLAMGVVPYLRSHQEAILDVYSLKLPFREESANRARWDQAKEVDRLSVRLLDAAGFDPHAAVEVPRLMEAFLVKNSAWKQDQIDLRFGSLTDRSMRSKVEIEMRKLQKKPQKTGAVEEIIKELNDRP